MLLWISASPEFGSQAKKPNVSISLRLGRSTATGSPHLSIFAGLSVFFLCKNHPKNPEPASNMPAASRIRGAWPSKSWTASLTRFGFFGKENPEGEEIGFRFMNHGPNTQNSSEILWMIRDHFESSSAPAECQNVIQQGHPLKEFPNVAARPWTEFHEFDMNSLSCSYTSITSTIKMKHMAYANVKICKNGLVLHGYVHKKDMIWHVHTFKIVAE